MSASEQTSAELTGHDRERFRDWVAMHMEMGMQSSPAAFARRALEYATIYERSKGQPDELSKAQARIAELEAALENIINRYTLVCQEAGIIADEVPSIERAKAALL